MLKSDTVIFGHRDCICPILLYQEVIVWKMQLSNNFEMILDQEH